MKSFFKTKLEKLQAAFKKTYDYLKATFKKVRDYFRVHLPVWFAAALVKSRILSDRCNERLLEWIKRLEDKLDPAEQFMADTSANNPQTASIFSHTMLWIMVVFFLIAFIWAKFAILDEVTVGEGKVIPASQVQVIQNLEGGIVKKIFVKEGQIVDAGQVLMQLDETHFISDYHEAQLKALALEAKIARLTSVIDNKPFVVSAELSQQAPDLVAHEKDLHDSQEKEQAELQDSYALVKKEYEMTKPLVAKGSASTVELLRLEQGMADKQQLIDGFSSRAMQDLNTAKGDLLTTNASLSQYKDRLSRTTIRSPVKGIVKQIKITTVGGISQPGMDLMEIVPLEDSLLVEAQIKPKDIGFLTIGQPAMVKITAYDFSIYGGLEGKVEEISADSITNQKGESYYIARIRTDKNYLRTSKNPLYIIPGMMASVDILTGRKSVLSYLLKPIIKARHEALRER